MEKAPIPANEDERLNAVHRLGILDTKPEERFDRFTKEAVLRLRTPISTISILDRDREWYKSCQGIDTKETDRSISFCGHSLLAKNIFIIEDTLKDPRFADNPLVTGKLFTRFYAGIALYDKKTSLPIGVMCVKDTQPRKLSLAEIDILMDIAKRAEEELNK